jgi:PPOX class probable F420-dependent enzyme
VDMTSAKQPEVSIPDTHVGILDTALLATVSTISHKDGLISTNPVAFDWDGEYLRLSTLKSRVKYRNLLANPQITFCAADPKMRTRYLEIREYAQITEDPDGSLNRKLFRRMTGTEMPADLDESGAERVIIKIVPTQVSAPTIYGGRVDYHAAKSVDSRKPHAP